MITRITSNLVSILTYTGLIVCLSYLPCDIVTLMTLLSLIISDSKNSFSDICLRELRITKITKREYFKSHLDMFSMRDSVDKISNTPCNKRDSITFNILMLHSFREVKPGFHMIVTIVATATIVQKFDWTIATILMIHGFHMIVAIAAVFMVERIRADDGYSVFTSVVTDSISPKSESIRSPFKIACYLFVLYEN